MKIVCKIKRPNGTEVEMPGGTKYHFKEDAKTGLHVCNIENGDHVAHLLTCAPETYYPEDGEPEESEDDETTIPTDLDVLPDDPEQWTNRQCMLWAKAQGLKGTNKQAMLDYANVLGIELPDPKAPAITLIRTIAKAVLI